MFAVMWKKIPALAAAVGLIVGSIGFNHTAFAAELPDRAFKVGFVTDCSPVSLADENGDLAGITRLVLDRISGLAGVEFDYVALPSGDVTYDYLVDEGFDLVTSVEYNKENQNARGILMSDPYLSSRKVIVAREGIDFTYNENLKVAISTGSQTLRKVLTSQYPNFQLVDYPSMEACLDALVAKKADILIQNQYVVEHWLYKPAYRSLKVVPIVGLDDMLCFSAVVPLSQMEGGPIWEERELLIGRLNEAISQLTEDEMALYIIEGTMTNPYKMTAGDIFYQYRYAAAALMAALLLIVVLLCLLLKARIRAMEDRADARAKGRFLSTMSHEIRTPLNGLIGLNYLMGQNLGDRQKLSGYLRQSTTTAKYLLSLVNDILDMSKLQEQSMKLDESNVNLHLLSSTAASIVKSGMDEKGIHFEIDIDLPYPEIIGDQARIQQVVMNMLDNARKFTAEGGHVSFAAAQEMDENGQVSTTFQVTDDGCGMSEEFREHIFDTFSQELETVSKGNQGTGLGMAISCRLARLMGGDLSVVSHKGEGSEFTFTFPARPAPTGTAEQEEWVPEEEAVPPRDKEEDVSGKILVAEDNELNAEIILELLNDVGVSADLAVNGREAVQRFAASREGEYRLILMDLLMPEMDGFEATRTIRAMKRRDAAAVRIYACTANSFQEDRDRAIASGMDDFIMKPIDVEALMKKLKE